MARRSNALVAINGDYARESGRPVFTFAADGALDQTELKWGRNFAVDVAESQAYVGHPKTKAWMYDASNGYRYSFDMVNAGAPGPDQLALFTPAGSWEEAPPNNACSVRLFRDSSMRVSSGGVLADYHVDTVRCGPDRLAPKGGVVVSTPAEGTRVTEITSLIPGQTLELGWTLGWANVVDAIGGNPTLIEDGQIVWNNVSGAGSFFTRHPRTGVGVTANGKVLFVTVDGRQKNYSIGMTLEQFADLMRDQGAVWALNLDGGGSTTMVVKGDVKNSPSDGHERAVSSALVLLRGKDKGESLSMGAPHSSASAYQWNLIASDPASTGGMADAMVRMGRVLPRSLLRAAAIFRSTR